MILNDYYWFFKSALDSETCDKIINMGLEANPNLGKTGKLSEDDSDLSKLKQIRNSNVSWLDERWLYELLQPYVHEANSKAGWNFDWDFSQACQFTVYSPGQYYDWHPDQNADVYTEKDGPNMMGKYRKLSMTVSLNDGSEYDGGELEFDMGKHRGKPVTKICNEIKPKGSIVVFPSFVYHRVLPVTQGTRYSLVVWHLGKPFQ